MAIIASARSRSESPARFAAPYSVTMYCVSVRDAETVLPEGTQGTMFDLSEPSFLLCVEARQMKPLPPLERNAPSRKSSCPPVPESCRVPAD